MSAVAPEAAAKQALVDLLTDHFAALDVGSDDKVLVTYGPPPQDTAQRRVAWTGGHEFDDEWGAVGAQAIDSTLEVRLVVDVTLKKLGGNPPREADQDAGAVVNEIRTAVRDAVRERRPIAEGVQWAGVTRGSSPDGPLPLDGGSWVVTSLVTVQFRVRIR